MLRSTAATALFALALLTSPAAHAQTQPAAEKPACGGDLGAFLEGVKAEAIAQGIPASAVDEALAGAQIDKKVLSRDRGQGVFRQTFLEFSKRTYLSALSHLRKRTSPSSANSCASRQKR